MEEIKDYFLTETWAAQILVVFAAALMVNFILRIILCFIERNTKKTKNKWDDALINAVKTPISAIIWILAVKFGMKIANEHSYIVDEALLLSIIETLLILCVVWFFMRIVNNIANYSIESGRIAGKDVDHSTIDALSKLAKIIIAIFATLVIMQHLGFSISGILAAGGAGGLVAGLAAKDMLANFFGGITIYLDKPFAVGDWIRSPDKSIEGTVEYIGWRQTRIRAFNKNPIYVPNAIFTTIIVENPSRMSHRRIKEIIGLRYDDIHKIEAITKDIRKMVDAHPEIDQEGNKIVNFNSFGASSLDIMFNVLILNTDWLHFNHVKHDILLKVAAIIEHHGAEIAFPTRTLHVAKD